MAIPAAAKIILTGILLVVDNRDKIQKGFVFTRDFCKALRKIEYASYAKGSIRFVSAFMKDYAQQKRRRNE